MVATSLIQEKSADDRARVNMWLVFLGPPGAGKGTQSQRLIDYLGAKHVSTGDILREVVQSGSEEGKEVEQYLAAGKLVPDPCIIRIFEHHLETLDHDDHILFDGFPRTRAQAEALAELLDQRGTPLSGAFYLKVETDELLRRLAGRGRKDDQVDVIRHRLEVFAEQTKPLIEHYRDRGVLHVIDGIGTEDEVFARIKGCIDEIAAQNGTQKDAS
ncbi:MAG: adenylate kinase [Pirellulales bacterium]|nr:adenylate kinase [Pirellulales bacterium]